MSGNGRAKLTLIMCLLVGGLTACIQQGIQLPATDDITKIEISIINPTNPTPSPCTISAKHYDQVLSLFRNAKSARFANKWRVFGTVTIHQSSTNSTTIQVYQTFKKRGAFRVNGRYYRTASDSNVVAILSRIGRDCQGTEQRNR